MTTALIFFSTVVVLYSPRLETSVECFGVIGPDVESLRNCPAGRGVFFLGDETATFLDLSLGCRFESLGPGSRTRGIERRELSLPQIEHRAGRGEISLAQLSLDHLSADRVDCLSQSPSGWAAWRRRPTTATRMPCPF